METPEARARFESRTRAVLVLTVLACAGLIARAVYLWRAAQS